MQSFPVRFCCRGDSGTPYPFSQAIPVPGGINTNVGTVLVSYTSFLILTFSKTNQSSLLNYHGNEAVIAQFHPSKNRFSLSSHWRTRRVQCTLLPVLGDLENEAIRTRLTSSDMAVSDKPVTPPYDS